MIRYTPFWIPVCEVSYLDISNSIYKTKGVLLLEELSPIYDAAASKKLTEKSK
ncbi:hypothetical protein RhiirA4_486028 [Rhizophagus irregularis]|uniref:Uncharacterized protein n=1 Tax=Rhizophagus irregularis TaxID=588596 RepID=A0A2I1HQY4_9GLOM|nr:hypothetical protein RhiirA4_486028 [Rhizophagus irregularis]